MGPLLVVALLLTTGGANLLWTSGLPASTNPVRLPSSFDPFPSVAPSSVLHVLAVPSSTNLSTRLTLISIQGLANRGRADLYLDFSTETGNASSILSFLSVRYGVSLNPVTADWVYRHYLPGLAGLVVYDPERPESINVVTMLAGLQNATIAGPDTAADLQARFGLRILFDYRGSDWASLDPAGVYDRALRELYPRCDSALLAILPPTRLPLRDYLIATRTFVFYQPQGILASPAELASTQRILAAAPRGIPILGWFDNPTLTEENAFIQLASASGKSVIGSQDVPDLSVLTAYGRNVTRSQAPPALAPPLEDRTYMVLAIPDGDNLDFVHSRMRTLWAEPKRGTVPLAWSVSPALADLAPPYLDYLYGSSTPNDRFVMGPSGAGYAYPDYFGPGDLGPFLEVTSRYAQETGMDVPWLLNAFVASEIPYSSATLSAYVAALHPRGLVLDYDDQAKTQDSWMQPGGTTAAPVIRSTQAWTTMDNLYAKVGAAMATWDAGPHFLWITLYTFRFDLGDGVRMIRELENRTSGRLVVVTPEQLFSLMEQDFTSRAAARLASVRSDPLAATLFAPGLAAAQAYLDSTAASGDPALAAYGGYLALATLRDVALEEAVAAFGFAVVLAALASRWPVRGRAAFTTPGGREVRSFLAVVAASALFLLAVRSALGANFWAYQWILIGAVLAGVGRSLSRHLVRVYPRSAPLATAALDVLFVALALMTNVAFGLAAIGTVATLDSVISREKMRPSLLVASLSSGSALGFLLSTDLVPFAALALLLLVSMALGRSSIAPLPTAPRGRGVSRGAVLALPLASLIVASNYSLALRLGLEGGQLSLLAAALLVLAPVAGLLVVSGSILRGPRLVQLGSFISAAGFAMATGFVVGLPAALLLFACIASLAAAAGATLEIHGRRGGELGAVAAGAISFIPVALILFRMPPVMYSLTIVHLPEALEAVLYAPEYVVALVAALLSGIVFLRLRSECRVGKGYPADGPLQGGRSS